MKFCLTSDLHAGFSKKTVRIHEKYFAKHAEAINDCAALLLAGDLISHNQHALETLFRTIRENISIPVVACFGNHDFWDRNHHPCPRSYDKLVSHRETIAYLYDVKLVSAGPQIFGDVVVVGFDGWYAKTDLPTNDRLHMAKGYKGEDPFAFLLKKAWRDLDALLELDLSSYRKKICLTHFPPFTDHIRYADYCANFNMLPFITEKFDFLCVGHSHRRNDFLEGECRVLNAGSDYDKPRHIIFEA